MDLGKLSANLGAAYLENSLAFAQLSFDFSLYKIEAPPDYQPLGASLTRRRRTEAEDGTQHVTARKLGALFKQIIPSTPHLIKAYGKRASEISANEKANPKGTKNDGGFAPFVGIDATTIWAGATSSPEAMASHLLACMLARMFSATDATSIWVELVDERKRQIEAKCNKDVAFEFELVAAAQAARQDISRAQLANWDASARAWLMTADEFRLRDHKQLMLLIKNCSLPVNNRTNVYESVTSAWTAAMIAAENLICGVPQQVQNGAILAGFSAWHIYPDVIIVMNREQQSKFGDPLVQAGGLLTIRLQSADEHENRGVHWSLSLAYLRYYGDLVLSTGETGTGAKKRVTFEQLGVATLGAIAGGWEYEDEVGIIAVAELLIELWELVSRFLIVCERAEQELESVRSRLHEARQQHNPLPPVMCPPNCEECKMILIFEADKDAMETKSQSLQNSRPHVEDFLACRPSWFWFLMKSSRSLMDSKGQKREEFLRLAMWALRRGRIFLGENSCHSAPAFGLLGPQNFLAMLDEKDRMKYSVEPL